MGLGPPVCKNCKILMTIAIGPPWRCIVCDSNDIELGLYEYSQEEQIDIREMTEFEKFWMSDMNRITESDHTKNFARAAWIERTLHRYPWE